ncbi:hypothetical protein ACSL9G_001647 [Vibrio fluvialis]
MNQVGIANEEEMDKERKIKEALKNPKFTWRTIRGIAKEAGVSTEQVRNYINKHGDEIVAASATNTKGERLFATRKNYRGRVGIARRMLAAVKNRGD